MTFKNIHAPLVSVIVINYNYGQFIEECLYSILNQSYPYIECLVIDNASTDSSVKILDRIVDRKDFEREGRSLSVTKSKVNLYQTPAGADIFKKSSGQFIIFFDADDYMLPTCVETHIRAMLYLRIPVAATCVDYFMSKGDDLTVSVSGLGFSNYVMSDAGRQSAFCRIPDMPHTGLDAKLDLKPSELHLVDRKARGWPWSGTCGLCFRREMVELMFTRVPALKAQLDAYLVQGINCLTGTVLIDRPLVVYRHHGSNIFAKGPLIANCHFYDPVAVRENASNTLQEIIETFVSVADILSKRLESRIIFIEAVATLSKTWPGLRPEMPVSSYTLQILIKHEHSLRQAFGDKEYRFWVLKNTKTLRDFTFVAWRCLTSIVTKMFRPASNLTPMKNDQ